jgi:hypothetical protein
MSRENADRTIQNEACTVFRQPDIIKELSIPPSEARDRSDQEIERQKFRIHLVNTGEGYESPYLILRHMYSWRKDSSITNFDRKANKIAMAVFTEQRTLARLTLLVDSAVGLYANDVFAPEVRALRNSGRKLCELGKFGVNQYIRSKKVLASLFHVAYVNAHHIHNCTDILAEVHPRHAAFFIKSFGFRQYGEERICKRINSPAVLLRLESAYVEMQVRKLAGRAEETHGEESIYPYFYPKTKEQEIARRLMLLSKTGLGKREA